MSAGMGDRGKHEHLEGRGGGGKGYLWTELSYPHRIV
jgi:hypothetical protein